jgi:lysophospholipase L1-like esterase
MKMTSVHPVDRHTTRRRFLSEAVTTAAGVATATSVLTASGGCQSVTGASGEPARSLIGSGDVVLFQGDSITDAGRDRGQEKEPNNARALGSGYAFLLASHLLAQHPTAHLKIYNRGISGHKVFQLAERWDKDCIALQPTLVSILIGVNDIWHTLNGNYQGTVEIYARDYRALIERTQRELPGVRLVICEPFVLRTGAVNEKWFPEFDLYRAAARKIATTFHAVFVPFQSMFDAAEKEAAPACWATDGVHPTLAGSYRMARAWLDAVSPAQA